ncbi:MFS transporter [Dysgonomonas sp. HGC4]|uniref:MFS transporter n=1 Tax=Dysgonomonas sp. HGC4 TaxID=1658009 RepID=UPI0006808172|nr:MFS transporter [Dysgonomonas sp. HGC4]MBD8348843.1 MFS transporter [Dysgonomonas sp. HGC4]
MNESPLNTQQSKLTKSTLWLMTIGAGLVVANNYYNQPLLGKIARELNVSEAIANNVAMITQIGYAAGLFLLVPLGDMFRKRKIIILDFVLIIASLIAFALSENITTMIIASFFIGLSSVVPQMFVPLAAQLSDPKEKGKNVGMVMTGLLIGILASRIFSGVLGEYLGWRQVYYIAAGIIFILWILIFFLLPDIKPTFKGSYWGLMKSISHYIKTVPSLRLASIRGALALGSFLAFWTTLTFHLERPPFFAGSDIAGELGAVGIGGALAASMVGRIADRVNKNTLIMCAAVLMIVSWAVLGIWGFTYAGLIVGIFILDVGLQSIHVSNQTIVFSTNPDATNRLNTVYMTSYFIGGSFGTFAGGKAWEYMGWNGVVLTGGAFVVILLLIHLIFSPKMK